jgi:hypothetical protein
MVRTANELYRWFIVASVNYQYLPRKEYIMYVAVFGYVDACMI